MNLTFETILHKAKSVAIQENGTTILLDPEKPNWLATDGQGESILNKFNGNRTFGQIVKEYGDEARFEWAKAWQHVETITRDALRQKFLTALEPEYVKYSGRHSVLKPDVLAELWIHTNNLCNLSCSHCLVSSGPDGDPGLPTEIIKNIITEARSLGTKRYYFTGGEPLARKDIFELIEEILSDQDAECAILTNGTLLSGKRLEKLLNVDRERLRLQISLDGSTAEINDVIRGNGSFNTICHGIKTALESGFHVTVTSAITENNADDIPNVTRLIRSLGGHNHHLLWLHKRGRADNEGKDKSPSVEKVISVVREAQHIGKQVGVILDNFEAIKSRINSPAGVKKDLSNACIESLCVYSNGNVYPSAATVNVPELLCGNIYNNSLGEIWRHSDVCLQFRQATVEEKEICPTCPFKYLCGGGDVEHSFFYKGSIMAHDPYCELHKAMIKDALTDLAGNRLSFISNGKSGYNSPVAITWMGENSVHCATGNEQVPDVLTSHSECVLSFDLDAPRKMVREFYGEAADEPQEELCCPVQPQAEDLKHIPKEVVERFYGCGSPIAAASIQPGEITLDLGSGAGIDVFIAAKKVTQTGQAIGVDMTDQMLRVATHSKSIVAQNLGYDVVEFRKGYMEELPIENSLVDVVTSNCVINLSPDKIRVFSEMWRVLKDHGRIVIADIVSAESVPTNQRRDPRLWGECISGALTEEEFLAYLERTGFYGLQVLSKTFWKQVEGYDFFSITVRGYKYEKKKGCIYKGQFAIYQGPFKSISDEEGHLFPRGMAVEICTDTASKLSNPPYAGQFIITEPDGSFTAWQCSGEGCC